MMDQFIDDWITQTFGQDRKPLKPEDGTVDETQFPPIAEEEPHSVQKLLICDSCGHAHFSQTYEQVLKQALDFGDYIRAADASTQEHFGFGPKTGRTWSLQEHINQSMKCFGCGAPYTQAHAASLQEQQNLPMGITLQPMVDKSTVSL